MVYFVREHHSLPSQILACLGNKLVFSSKLATLPGQDSYFVRAKQLVCRSNVANFPEQNVTLPEQASTLQSKLVVPRKAILYQASHVVSLGEFAWTILFFLQWEHFAVIDP